MEALFGGDGANETASFSFCFGIGFACAWVGRGDPLGVEVAVEETGLGEEGADSSGSLIVGTGSCPGRGDVFTGDDVCSGEPAWNADQGKKKHAKKKQKQKNDKEREVSKVWPRQYENEKTGEMTGPRAQKKKKSKRAD